MRFTTSSTLLLVLLVVAPATHSDARHSDTAAGAVSAIPPRTSASVWMPDVAERLAKLRGDVSRAAAVPRDAGLEQRWSIACPPPRGLQP